MTRLERVLAAVLEELSKLGHAFALVGGLAVSTRTEPRFTRDVDLVVSISSDHEAESVVRHFVTGGYSVLTQLEQDAAHRLAAVRLLTPHGSSEGIVVDLLFASSGIESEIVAEADPIEIFPDVRLPVAKAEHLIALKVLSREDATRPQDRADLVRLLGTVDSEELARAREALALIQTRGFDRGRALLDELDALVQSIS